MKSRIRLAVLLVVLWLTALLTSQPANIQAQSGGSYEIARFTIDAAGTAQGSGYQFITLAGQPDVGSTTGQGYELAGAFWPSGLAINDVSPLGIDVYLPLVITWPDSF